MYKMLSHVMELYDIVEEKYKPYLWSFIRQETMQVPIRIKEILNSRERGVNNPVFPKRQYKLEDEDIEKIESRELKKETT